MISDWYSEVIIRLECKWVIICISTNMFSLKVLLLFTPIYTRNETLITFHQSINSLSIVIKKTIGFFFITFFSYLCRNHIASAIDTIF